MKRLEVSGLSASQQHLATGGSIAARQAQIEAQYTRLLNLAKERLTKLAETVKAYVLVREAAELATWIKDKVWVFLFLQIKNMNLLVKYILGEPCTSTRCWRRFRTGRSHAKEI